jgi:hypothetical protein
MKRIAFFDADDIFLQWIPDFNEEMAKKGVLKVENPREYVPQAWGYPELGMGYGPVQDYVQAAPMHPPYEEMVDLMRRLRKAGWEVVIITSHPSDKMMERVRNLALLGEQFYDHLVLTLTHDPSGKIVSISKADYIEGFYREKSIKIFVDDRLKSVNEFVRKGLGLGFSVDRAYNDLDLAELHRNPDLDRCVYLGRGKTMREQLLDLIPQIEKAAEQLSKG